MKRIYSWFSDNKAPNKFPYLIFYSQRFFLYLLILNNDHVFFLFDKAKRRKFSYLFSSGFLTMFWKWEKIHLVWIRYILHSPQHKISQNVNTFHHNFTTWPHYQGQNTHIPLCRYVINLENVNHFMKRAIKCIPKNHEVHKTEPWSLHDEQRLQYSGRKKSDIWKYICALWTSMNLFFLLHGRYKYIYIYIYPISVSFRGLIILLPDLTL